MRPSKEQIQRSSPSDGPSVIEKRVRKRFGDSINSTRIPALSATAAKMMDSVIGIPCPVCKTLRSSRTFFSIHLCLYSLLNVSCMVYVFHGDLLSCPPNRAIQQCRLMLCIDLFIYTCLSMHRAVYFCLYTEQCIRSSRNVHNTHDMMPTGTAPCVHSAHSMTICTRNNSNCGIAHVTSGPVCLSASCEMRCVLSDSSHKQQSAIWWVRRFEVIG